MANGCSVGGYVWLYRNEDARRAVHEAVTLARDEGVELPVLWLDVETYNGVAPTRAEIEDAIVECHMEGVRPGIYTASWMTSYVDFSGLGRIPCWGASYNDTPTLESVRPFGPWTEFAGHQFTSNPLDQNVFARSVV